MFASAILLPFPGSRWLFIAITLTPKKRSTQCFISVLVDPDSTLEVYWFLPNNRILLSVNTAYLITLLMTLIGVKIGKIENGVDKIREILAGKGVWLEWFGGRENVGFGCFLPGPTTFQPSKSERKWGGEKVGWPTNLFFFSFLSFYGLFIKFFTCLFYFKIIFFFHL